MSDDAQHRLRAFSFQVYSKLEGAFTAGMIHLGDRLGLYEALAAADGPVTSDELADATGLQERWVREWLHNQAAAQLLELTDDHGRDRFGMSGEARAVLASPNHPAFGIGMFHRLPQTMQALEAMPESFRTGLGHDYDSHGPEGAVGIERSFEPWNHHNLLRKVLPAMDGVVERLTNGATVADVGCGAGGAVLLMAEAFPNSTFTGYDISRHALDRAEARLAAAGLTNARFVDPRDEPLPVDGSLDLVTTFDCIHDMAHPTPVVDALRGALRDDGYWLLVDIRAAETLAENIELNPMAPLLYGVSVLSCMSSALSEPDGEGLGTLGLPASKAEAMANAAGFSRFETLDVSHPMNAFYEVRP
ncbi:MAG: class I SAM-dependent methyltransferase [Ilumatobacteraceae bacterium]|nr:class I SAM-dependent methyltransferase [Ilumatobacteraceae bacterium]